MPTFCGEPNGMARLQFEAQEEACMARYKVIDHEIDLSDFDGRYRNDTTGACAYPPG